MNGIIGRTLKEVAGADLKVKLGAQSGFIYCGNLKDLDLKTLDETILEHKGKMVERRLSEIVSAVRKTAQAFRRYMSHENIAERGIIDFYPSTTEEDTYIIIIEGDESGKAWTTDEYNGYEGSV